jgi:hypothetical protein
VIYALHKPYYRSMSLLGLKAPNGLLPGIIAIAVGIATQYALLRLIPG